MGLFKFIWLRVGKRGGILRTRKLSLVLGIFDWLRRVKRQLGSVCHSISYFRIQILNTAWPRYIKKIKLRGIRGRVWHYVQERLEIIAELWQEKPEGKRQPGTARRRWKFNSKLRLKQVARERSFLRKIWLRRGNCGGLFRTPELTYAFRNFFIR